MLALLQIRQYPARKPARTPVAGTIAIKLAPPALVALRRLDKCPVSTPIVREPGTDVEARA
jgi:hypothetical protein